VAAELRLGEKCTRQAKNLVRLAKFAEFSLGRLDALLFRNRCSWTLAGITLLLAYPATRRLRRAADLGGNPRACGPLRLVPAAGFADHAYSALDDFGGILGLLFHSSIFSKDEASTKLGAVHAGYIDYEQAVVLLTAPTLAALG